MGPASRALLDKDRPGLPILAVLSLAYFCAESFFHIFQWNGEGFLMLGAYEVYHGARPYRDFATFVPPGMLYLLGWLFELTGPALVPSRLLTTALPKWMTALLVLETLGRLGFPYRVAAAGAAFCTLALGAGTFTGSDFTGVQPTVLCTLWCLLATRFLIERFLSGHDSWAGLAGALAGLTALFRYDLAVYCVLGNALAAALALGRGGPGGGWAALGRSAACYAGGAAAVVLPVAAYFLWQVPWDNLWLCFVEYPAAYLRKNLRADLSVLFPHPFAAAWRAGPGFIDKIRAWLIYDAFRTLVFATYAWAVAWLWGRWRGGGGWGGPERGLSALACLGLAFFGYWIKSQNLFSLSVPIYVLLPALIAANWGSRSRARQCLARLSAVWLGGLWLVMFACKPILPRRYHRFIEARNARWLLVPEKEAAVVEALARAVQREVPPGGRLLVCDEHFYDMSPLNLYLLADRRPGTAFYEFFPYITSREGAQRRIIAELEANGVRLVIQEDWPLKPEQVRVTSVFLKEFLAREFEEVERHGRFRVLRRRGGAPRGGLVGMDKSA